MNYPIVFDKFETAFASHGLAVLENAKNVKIREVINGEYLLTIILPRNDPKWQYIQPENFIHVKGQNYRIRTFDEQRDKDGKLTANVQCEHVYYDANDCKHIPNLELVGVTPKYALETIFEGTRFTIGTVEITTLTDIFVSKVSPVQAVAKLIENVGGELLKDNWAIHLLKRRGTNSGVQFRVGKNIQTLKKSTDSKSVVTRLYPYGKDSMEIYSVNGGKAYIDSPLINNYDRPKIGHKDYKDIEDPAELLAAAQAEFSTAEKDGTDKPQVTYSTEVVALKKLAEYGSLEEFFIGDTVRIIDHGLDTDTLQRIIEYEEYPFEAQKDTVNLANYSPQVYRENTTGGMLAGFSKSSSYVDTVTNEKGQLNPGWFENIKTKLKTMFNGKIKNAVVHSQGDIWVDDPENPTKAMGVLADGFAIANSKLPNGDWDWKTFGTADGFVADLITAGKLKGVTIEVSTNAKIGNRLNIGDVADKGIFKAVNFFGNADPNGISPVSIAANENNGFYFMFINADKISLYGSSQIELSAPLVTYRGKEIATIEYVNGKIISVQPPI